MKKVAIAVLGLSLSGQIFAASFLNGGFEDGNLNGWTYGGGNTSGAANSSISPGSFLPGGNFYSASVTNQVVIVGPGNDPVMAARGVTLNQVNTGNYSVRVGDSGVNYFGGSIAQSVVNYGATTINFSWAAVMESQHGSSDAPQFQVRLTDLTTSSVVYQTVFAAYPGAPNPPGVTFNVVSGVAYTTWQNISINSVIGHDYRIELATNDCGQGGHFGYAYLDGFGSVAGGAGDNGQVTPPTGTVPLPGSLALVLAGLSAVAIRRKRA